MEEALRSQQLGVQVDERQPMPKECYKILSLLSSIRYQYLLDTFCIQMCLVMIC